MLGGSRIIARDGRIVAGAPLLGDLVCTPELLVADGERSNSPSALPPKASQKYSTWRHRQITVVTHGRGEAAR
jgi:hypothetical protein